MSHSPDPPKGPDDVELRKIIDKLAQFVARNGPEFEQMTKQKQTGNPRFAFLFGGENYHYYQHRVNEEKENLRKASSQMDPNFAAKIQALQIQIFESEHNLKAQFDSLMQQQLGQVEQAVYYIEGDLLNQFAQECQINLDELRSVMDSLKDACSKDAISSCKSWIFEHFLSFRHGDTIMRFLMKLVKNLQVSFKHKLHVLYLINDLLHQCFRKQEENMLLLLRRYIVALYCVTYQQHADDEEQRAKMEKLVGIWEKQGYFDDSILTKLRDVQLGLQSYQLDLANEYGAVVSDIVQRFRAKYQQYEIQHQEFARHIQQQLSALESQQDLSSAMGTTPFSSQAGVSSGVVLPGQQAVAASPRRSRFDSSVPSSIVAGQVPVSVSSLTPCQLPSNVSATGLLGHCPPGFFKQQGQPPAIPPWQNPAVPQAVSCPMPSVSLPPFASGSPFPVAPGSVPPFFNQAPSSGSVSRMPALPVPNVPSGPNVPPWNGPVPAMPFSGGPGDMPGGVQRWVSPGPENASSPQPMAPMMQQPAIPLPIGPPRPLFDEQALIPKVAYYDLPAGVMVPLVKLEDHDYKPLKPEDIRLPPPMPPSERLVMAVEAFYAPPNHENPRDSEGWERLGLYEYYASKSRATAKDGKSPERSPDQTCHDNRSRSRSHSRSASRSHSRDKSRSRSRSKSKSRSRSRSISRSSSPAEEKWKISAVDNAPKVGVK